MHTYMTDHTPQRRATDVTKFVPGAASCMDTAKKLAGSQSEATTAAAALTAGQAGELVISPPRKRRCFALMHTTVKPAAAAAATTVLLPPVHLQKKMFGRSCEAVTYRTGYHIASAHRYDTHNGNAR